MNQYSKEDILAKAEWEGGLVDTLEWFDPTEVPAPIQVLWEMAYKAKELLDYLSYEIQEYLESE